METFDITEKLQIDISFARIAHNQNPGFNGRLIDVMTEEHLKQALREYFSDCPEWHEGLMKYALKMYYDTEKMEREATDMVNAFMTRLLPHY